MRFVEKRLKIQRWLQKWWYPGDPGEKELEVPGEPPYYYLVNEDRGFTGRCITKTHLNGKTESEIKFNLSQLCANEEELIPLELTYVELEELTHWAGEHDVEDNHSEIWFSTLMQLACESTRDTVEAGIGEDELEEYSP